MHHTKPINVQLLDLLLETKTGLTTEAMASQLGLSREQVEDELEILKHYGCEVASHSSGAVRLIESGLGVWSDYLVSQSAVLRDVFVFGTTNSTQDICKKICEDEKPKTIGKLDHTIVIANLQTGGRGRLGRKWISPAGCAITCSMIKAIKSQSDVQTINQMTFAISVAVAKTVEHF